MSGAPIQVEGLRFVYPEARGADSGPDGGFELALEGWTVAAGERWALHGPSGCGKSTLLDLVAGVRLPSSGTVRVEGRDWASLGEAERRAWRLRRVGFVFQDFPLVDYLDALDNVLLPYRLHASLDLDEAARERARGLLADLGLGTKGGRRPRELSQGERQRLALARALVTEPGLILADEPTAGLDPERASAVLDLLEALSAERRTTLLLVTHDPAILERFENRLDVGSLGPEAET